MAKESIKQAAKFSLVGIFNTLADYVVFYIMLAFLNLDKSVSQIIATAVAMSGSYIINKNWTFKACRTSKAQIVKFVVTNIVSMSLTILFMNLFHDALRVHEWTNTLLSFVGIAFKLDGDLGVMFCKVSASVLSLVVNFLGNKFWVFAKK